MNAELPKCIQARHRLQTMATPLAKAVTLHGCIWEAPSGRAGKGSSTVLCLLAREWPLPAKHALWLTPSRHAESINIALLGYG